MTPDQQMDWKMIVLVEPKIDVFPDEICLGMEKGQTEIRDFVLT